MQERATRFSKRRIEFLLGRHDSMFSGAQLKLLRTCGSRSHWLFVSPPPLRHPLPYNVMVAVENIMRVDAMLTRRSSSQPGACPVVGLPLLSAGSLALCDLADCWQKKTGSNQVRVCASFSRPPGLDGPAAPAVSTTSFSRRLSSSDLPRGWDRLRRQIRPGRRSFFTARASSERLTTDALDWWKSFAEGRVDVAEQHTDLVERATQRLPPIESHGVPAIPSSSRFTPCSSSARSGRRVPRATSLLGVTGLAHVPRQHLADSHAPCCRA